MKFYVTEKDIYYEGTLTRGELYFLGPSQIGSEFHHMWWRNKAKATLFDSKQEAAQALFTLHKKLESIFNGHIDLIRVGDTFIQKSKFNPGIPRIALVSIKPWE